MRLLPKTLLTQLSLVVMLGSVLAGVITGVFFVRQFLSYVHIADQFLQYETGRNLAAELEPLAVPELNPARLQAALRRLTELFPRMNIYVLDKKGEILLNGPLTKGLVRTKVDPRPIQDFLESNGSQKLAIYGDDPAQSNEKTIFSAAPFVYLGNPGYLYVILESARYREVLSVFGESHLYQLLLLYVAIAAIPVGAMGILVLAFILRRVRQLTGVLTEFASGNHAVRVSDIKDDELGFQAGAFNSMADKIESSIAALEKSETLRRELVANVSHDLRTPLAVSRGLVETALQGRDSLNSQERHDLLQTALGSLDSLSRLVSDLFELSKLEANYKKPEFDAFSLSELAHDTVEKLRALAGGKSITVHSDIPAKACHAWGDIAMIERVLTNIIENAIAYSPTGSTVEVGVSEEHGGYKVWVSDKGKGIAPEMLPKIFDRFCRAGTTTGSGAGLGLAIVKRIVEMHGSTIEVSSQPGAGTTFWFHLPPPPA